MRNLGVVFLLAIGGCLYATEERVVVIDDRGEGRPLPTTEDPTGTDRLGPPGSGEEEDDCGDPLVAPTPSGPDVDGDGLSDADEEEVYDTAPDHPDTDVDGLPDGLEIVVGTDPTNPDTDADHLLDGAEIAACTDPLNPDTDGDGVLDGDEVLDATDPLNPDTDEDGLDDGDEGEAGTDPRTPDTDDDGITDGDEVGSDTDPLDGDSDDDDLSDGEEQDIGTDPLNPDTDDDGLTDGEEDDIGTHPILDDTDGDGVDDGPEIDIGTDPLVPDTDGDGIDDGDEIRDETDPTTPDTDDDGLDDGDEADEGTDPNEPDTDGDGAEDGTEIDEGSDPLDPGDAGRADAEEGEGEARWAVKRTEGCTACDTAATPTFAPALLVGLLLVARRRVRSAAALASIAALSGCYHQETTFEGTDAIPVITGAYARCTYDPGGLRWTFGVNVTDEDGLDDVIAVEATVVDGQADEAEALMVLELFEMPTSPAFWYRETDPRTLDCNYPAYAVAFVAYDHLVASDTVVVWADAL